MLARGALPNERQSAARHGRTISRMEFFILGKPLIQQTPNSASDIGFGQVSLQQKRAEIRKCIGVVTVSDVPAGKLDAAMNIGILLTFDQRSHGFGRAVFCFHLNRDQGHCRSDEKILFQ